jgi:hypothetical protein
MNNPGASFAAVVVNPPGAMQRSSMRGQTESSLNMPVSNAIPFPPALSFRRTKLFLFDSVKWLSFFGSRKKYHRLYLTIPES